MNFDEIFRRDVTYDNLKSHKKQGFTLSLKNTFLEKLQGGLNRVIKLIPHSLFRINLTPRLLLLSFVWRGSFACHVEK